jgi:hypothetical protein
MKIEKNKSEYDSLFKDVKRGQCFKHFTGDFYIKIMEISSSRTNCISLAGGAAGICDETDKVTIFENAKVVLGD